VERGEVHPVPGQGLEEQAEEQRQALALVVDEEIEESLVGLLAEVEVEEAEAAGVEVAEIELEVGLEAQGLPWEETALEEAYACKASEASACPCSGLEEMAWVPPTGTAVVVSGR
jgi:hypothetical protein